MSDMRAMQFSDNFSWGENGLECGLCCPECGGANLHHEEVTENDDPGVIITFWCENCDNHPRLQILQYKGTTFIGWITPQNKLARALKMAKEVQEVHPDTWFNPDPWKHRSKGMLCHTCMHFVLKEATGTMPEQGTRIGRCRRHAPTMSGYPVVFESDWCGDHKLNEEKI